MTRDARAPAQKKQEKQEEQEQEAPPLLFHSFVPSNFTGTVTTFLLLLSASLLSEFACPKNFRSDPFSFSTMCI
jgi:hypothetical protein